MVFLSSLSRGFNKEDLRAQVLCDGELGLGLSAVDRENRVRYPTIAKRAIVARTSSESLSEELRVLYVAMTRARDRLIMTYAEKNPAKTLAAIANRLDLGGTELLASEVSCPGEWVLMEALCRTEAGALHALADARPNQTHLSDFPWRIVTADCAPAEGLDAREEEAAPAAMPDGTVELLRQQLMFRYPHEAATVTPSKQTATQLKGRDKDDEIQENAEPTPKQRTWRRFGDRTARRGIDYGVAMHTVMQYVRFDACVSLEGLEKEISRLAEARIIPAELAPKLDRNAILAFFRTELGRKLMTGKYIREFKFSILDMRMPTAMACPASRSSCRAWWTAPWWSRRASPWWISRPTTSPMPPSPRSWPVTGPRWIPIPGPWSVSMRRAFRGPICTFSI